jgi:uncharacterized surface protein with fasciclin (FAS1) repeats
MYKRSRWLSALLVALLVLGFAPAASAQYTPEVFAVDHDVVDATVVVSRATINEAGWVVIHADINGLPGLAVGSAPLPKGVSANVRVPVQLTAATETLHAVLHSDAGTLGTYEFPGPDLPLMVSGKIVMDPFTVKSQQDSIVGALQKAGTFTTLLAAVEAAGLTEDLRKTNPLTLFAPSDDAFAALPAGAVDGLLADPEALSNVLLLHLAPEAILSTDITEPREVETLQGELLAIAPVDGVVKVNDAQVTSADLVAYNGVIHTIDTVLLPPAPAEEAAPAEAPAEAATEAATEEAPTMDIIDTAVAAGSFNTLAELLGTANLVDTLKGPGPFTVLAPTDEAFAKLPAATLNLFKFSPALLQQVLLYHVFDGALPSSSVVDGLQANALNGQPVTFNVGSDGAVTANGAAVVMADVAATNGIIHAIDTVLVPSVRVVAAATATAAPTPAPTEEATPEATEVATEEATPEATAVATEEATPEATAVATEEATPEATAVATEEATPEATEVATEEATPEATAVATEEATPEATAVATEEATPEATEVATEEATPEATAVATEEVTPEATEVATEEATPEATAVATEEATPEAAVATPTLFGLLTAGDEFSTLVAALEAAGLTGALDAEGSLTLFAPTNDAFAALPAGTVDDLLADPEALTQVLLYHVVGEGLAAADIAMMGEIETLQGGMLTVDAGGDPLKINDAAVTAADVAASNGVLHVIDAVLTPAVVAAEATAEATPEATAVATEEATPEATAVATEEATPEATAVATEEATPEATAVATEEATPEATAVATEEATPEATAVATEEPTPAEPEVMPDTGGSFGALPTLPATGLVLMALAALAFVNRRK